jgi:hypothetical protein
VLKQLVFNMHHHYKDSILIVPSSFWQGSMSNKVEYRLKEAEVQQAGVIANNVLVCFRLAT